MVRIGIIGAGNIGSKHLEAINMINDVKITAIVDLNENNAKIQAAKYGAKAYASLTECLPDVDAIGIYTPPSSHCELAIEAMDAGKHVICEKPITTTKEDALAIKKSAEKNNVVFMTAFNMRFREGYNLLHDAILSEEIGKPINYFVQRMSFVAGSPSKNDEYNWRTDPNLMCGMTVESLSHDIDMIRWHFGEVKTVYAVIQYSLNDLPYLDDNAYIVMTLENGMSVSIQATWSSHIPQNMRGVVGTKGTAYVKGFGIWDSDEFTIKTADMPYQITKTIQQDILDVVSYYKENLHFFECIKNRKQPQTTAFEGLKALEISSAILESGKTGKVIML
jgi:myo-inositol 2-dehydrogenase/D-chiro-inositol 1-dehydrogenase